MSSSDDSDIESGRSSSRRSGRSRRPRRSSRSGRSRRSSDSSSKSKRSSTSGRSRRSGSGKEKIDEINKTLDVATGKMHENLSQIIGNNDIIDRLEDKSEILIENSHVFHKDAKVVAKRMWWKNFWYGALLFGTVALVILLALYAFTPIFDRAPVVYSNEATGTETAAHMRSGHAHMRTGVTDGSGESEMAVDGSVESEAGVDTEGGVVTDDGYGSSDGAEGNVVNGDGYGSSDGAEGNVVSDDGYGASGGADEGTGSGDGYSARRVKKGVSVAQEDDVEEKVVVGNGYGDTGPGVEEDVVVGDDAPSGDKEGRAAAEY